MVVEVNVQRLKEWRRRKVMSVTDLNHEPGYRSMSTYGAWGTGWGGGQGMRQYLANDRGGRIAVVLSLEEYEKLLEAAEELEDIRLFDEAMAGREREGG